MLSVQGSQGSFHSQKPAESTVEVGSQQWKSVEVEKQLTGSSSSFPDDNHRDVKVVSDVEAEENNNQDDDYFELLNTLSQPEVLKCVSGLSGEQLQEYTENVTPSSCYEAQLLCDFLCESPSLDNLQFHISILNRAVKQHPEWLLENRSLLLDLASCVEKLIQHAPASQSHDFLLNSLSQELLPAVISAMQQHHSALGSS